VDYGTTRVNSFWSIFGVTVKEPPGHACLALPNGRRQPWTRQFRLAERIVFGGTVPRPRLIDPTPQNRYVNILRRVLAVASCTVELRYCVVRRSKMFRPGHIWDPWTLGPGHTHVSPTLEQPPCAPCFAGTERTLISAWACTPSVENTYGC
jgi:hypothetical protein